MLKYNKNNNYAIVDEPSIWKVNKNLIVVTTVSGTDIVKIPLSTSDFTILVGDVEPVRYGGTSKWGRDKMIIPLTYTSGSTAVDNVLVLDITVCPTAGENGWCTCTKNGTILIYKAIQKNPTGFPRYAYFKHKTTNGFLTNGDPVYSEWWVTVMQEANPNPDIIRPDEDTPDPIDPDDPTPTENYWNTGLPVVFINTNNREIPSPTDDWLENVEIEIYERYGDQPSYQSQTLQVRGRGNSTWRENKKPYALKLEKKSEILGMSSHKRWCLLANALDRTLMRNDLAFALGLQTELDWTPHGKFVELVLNNEHKGNYYLCEQIRVSENRVDIDEENDYLLENDSYYDEPYKFTSSRYGYYYNIKSPDIDDIQTMQDKLSQIQDKINEIEDSIYLENGYDSSIDFDSFIDYWFVTELAGLIELRQTSNDNDKGPHSMYFLYISETDKLKAGPIWDFDLFTFLESVPAAVNYNVNGLPTQRTGDLDQDIELFYIVDKKVVMDTPYYTVLFNDSNFTQKVKQKWATVKPKFLLIINSYIDSNYTKLSASDALNTAIWGIPGKTGHHPDGGLSFREATTKMKVVCNTRINYMDQWINEL